MSFHIRNRTTEACKIASLQAGSIKSHTAVVASKIHCHKRENSFQRWTYTPHAPSVLSKNVTSWTIPPLLSVLLSSPLHPTSLPHVLSEGRWIALFCDINNMSYCWSVRGKACELSIPSHWLHDWDVGCLSLFFFLFSFYPSNSLWPSISLSLISLLCLF